MLDERTRVTTGPVWNRWAAACTVQKCQVLSCLLVRRWSCEILLSLLGRTCPLLTVFLVAYIARCNNYLGNFWHRKPFMQALFQKEPNRVFKMSYFFMPCFMSSFSFGEWNDFHIPHKWCVCWKSNEWLLVVCPNILTQTWLIFVSVDNPWTRDLNFRMRTN